MTTPVTAQRNTVLTAGFSNPLNLPANAEAASHVQVYGDDVLLVNGPDYTLDGVGDTGNLDEIAGVNVIIDDDVIIADLYTTFTVVHVPPIENDSSLASGGVLGRIYEAAIDALTRRMQRVFDYASRSPRLPVDVVVSDIHLPHPDPRKALVWNEAGDGFDNSLSDPDSTELAETAAFADAAAASAADAATSETNAATSETNAAASAADAAAAAATAGDLTALLAFLVPVGTSIMHNAATAPTNYLKENGAAVSRTTYAALFAEIGTTHGVGDGSTTFNLPESRGEFFRGLDDSRGIDTGRTIGSAQSEMIGPHTHTASSASAGAHTHTITLPWRHGANGVGNLGYWSDGDSGGGSYTNGTTTNGAHSHTITVDNNTGTENRPRNKAKLMCIKY